SLDRERDTLFVDVDFRDGCLDDIALAVVLDGFFATTVPGQVGQVNHAVDVVVEANEQTELGDVLDFAFDGRANRVGLSKDFPRIAHGLLETKGNATLGRVDLEHHDFDFLRGRNDLAGVHVLFGPGHFRDVNKTLDTGFQLHKGAVIGDIGDAAF